MKFKFGVQQAIASSAVFALIIVALVSVDARVRERFTDLVSGGESLGSWADRASFLGDAMMSAARQQSIENAPMVIFATVGAVLFLFMVRT